MYKVGDRLTIMHKGSTTIAHVDDVDLLYINLSIAIWDEVDQYFYTDFLDLPIKDLEARLAQR